MYNPLLDASLHARVYMLTTQFLMYDFWVSFIDTCVFTCTHYLVLNLSLIGWLFDSSGPTCLDPGAWGEVDPSAEDRVYLAEQTDQL